MEALTAASVAALTAYDMVKGVERGVEIRSIHLVSKSGGQSGEWRRPVDPAADPSAGAGIRGRGDPASGSPVGSARRPEARARCRTRRSARSRPAPERSCSRSATASPRDRARTSRASPSRTGSRTLGFRVDRAAGRRTTACSIEHALRSGATDHALIVSTGGTGLTPRDVTPQATLAVIDYEVPGLAEAMRAAGRAKTPMADLSRGVVGVIGRSLVVNVPGSPRAALESLAALEPTLVHALETLAGPFDHGAAGARAPATDRRRACCNPSIPVGIDVPAETTFPPDRTGDAAGDLYGDPPLPDDERRVARPARRGAHVSEIRR